MCGRYLFISEEDELKELLYLASFGSGLEPGPNDLPDGDISPGMSAPVITGFSEDSIERSKKLIKAEMAVWGIPMTGRNSLIINSRRENLLISPIFSRLLDSGRCVIPASGYYEWKREIHEEKQPAQNIQISLFDSEPPEDIVTVTEIKRKYLFAFPGENILYMAGLCDHTGGGRRFTIITGAAEGRAADIHHRMPLILTKDRIKAWLTDVNSAAEILSDPIPVPDYRSAG